MARKRFSAEDILNLLRQIELSLASGSDVATACGSAGVSDATCYNWRKAPMAGWVNLNCQNSEGLRKRTHS